MSLTDLKQKAIAKVTAYRVAITTLLLSGLVGMASAAPDINASVSPIIYEVVKLFVPLLAVLLGSLPIIISMAIIAFILGILAMILSKLK